MSGAEANLFVESVNDFVRTVKELGPLGKCEGIDEKGLKFKLDAVTSSSPISGWWKGRGCRVPPITEEEYHTFFASDELSRLFDELIGDKLAISQIMSLLEGKTPFHRRDRRRYWASPRRRYRNT